MEHVSIKKKISSPPIETSKISFLSSNTHSKSVWTLALGLITKDFLIFFNLLSTPNTPHPKLLQIFREYATTQLLKPIKVHSYGTLILFPKFILPI